MHFINVLCIISWTYCIISWWCRMQASNFAPKSEFRFVRSCLFPCRCRGVICSCLISNMSAFSLSNWLQATAIRVVTRDMLPHTADSDSRDVKHWKNLNIYNRNLSVNEAFKKHWWKQFQPTVMTLGKWKFWLNILVFQVSYSVPGM